MSFLGTGIFPKHASPNTMLYTAEPYERVRMVLRSLCVSRRDVGQTTCSVSEYRSRDVVYGICRDGRQVYVIGDKIFELCPGDFHVGIQSGKEVQIRLARFTTSNRHGEYRQMEGTDIRWTEMDGVEFDVGPVALNGKDTGTLFVFNGSGGSSVVSNALRKFVRVVSLDGRDKCFERSLVEILSLGRVL